MRGTPLSPEEIALTLNVKRRPQAPFVPRALRAHEDAADDTVVIDVDEAGTLSHFGNFRNPSSRLIIRTPDGEAVYTRVEASSLSRVA